MKYSALVSRLEKTAGPQTAARFIGAAAGGTVGKIFSPIGSVPDAEDDATQRRNALNELAFVAAGITLGAFAGNKVWSNIRRGRFRT